MMTATRTGNPFRPGDGQSPPYLAGRENEQNRIREILANMANGESPAANMVMYGPRGMGKTALVSWIGNEAEKTGKNNLSLRAIQTSPTIFPSLQSLWNKLISDDWKKKFWPDQLQLGGLGNKIVWNSKAPSEDDLVSVLIEECKERPLVLLMDEAHTMDSRFCQDLLNISQQARMQAPFFLVLAGTPGLMQYLKTVGASFVERSKKMGIARLDAQAAADAIVKPLNEHGIEIDDSSLAQVVEDSQHYPYFIQLWGAALWDIAKENNLQTLTVEEVVKAKAVVEIERVTFYKDRRDTLEKEKLLPACVAMATLFQERETITKDTLLDVIIDSFSVDSIARDLANDHLFTLIRHEFVWAPPGTDLYEAAIPSLMTYVLDKEREHVQGSSKHQLIRQDQRTPSSSP